MRAERLRRRKFRRNLFVVIAVQMVIAGVAFVGVRDYMSDGRIRQAAGDALAQIMGGAPETGTVAVPPPPELDTAANAEIAAVEQSPAPSNTVEPPVAQIASPADEPAPDVQVAPEEVEPEPEPQVEAQAETPEPEVEAQAETPEPQVEAQAETPESTPAEVAALMAAIGQEAATPEPAPPVEVVALMAAIGQEVATPAPAPAVEEPAAQQVAAVPVPDLTSQKTAPSVIEQPGLAGSQQKEGIIFRDCDICPELVSIAPGEFMVNPEGRGTAQQALAATDAKKVAVEKPFAIGRYEITFDDWRRCVEGGGCKGEPADDGWGRERRPVIHVSYNEISEQYLPWLSKLTGFAYRLPTEAEWELASQGGNTSSRGGISETGSSVPVACSYGNSSDVAAKTRETIWAGVGCNDGFLYSAPVGSLNPNSLGIFDMHGNVWEWVSDCWRATYDTEEAGNDGNCKYHVLRGGSWASEFRFLPDGVWVGDAVAYRAAVRGWETSVKARNSIGFRVARSQP